MCTMTDRMLNGNTVTKPVPNFLVYGWRMELPTKVKDVVSVVSTLLNWVQSRLGMRMSNVKFNF